MGEKQQKYLMLEVMLKIQNFNTRKHSKKQKKIHSIKKNIVLCRETVEGATTCGVGNQWRDNLCGDAALLSTSVRDYVLYMF